MGVDNYACVRRLLARVFLIFAREIRCNGGVIQDEFSSIEKLFMVSYYVLSIHTSDSLQG